MGLSDNDLTELEARLGYHFANRELLERALTHRSFANENPEAGRDDNETLEFLGDAVLDLVVGHTLMLRFPRLREGELSVMRSYVVSEAGLVQVAVGLQLGRWLALGKGEERSGGRDKRSLLADTMEAVIAAVYLDANFAAAWELVTRLFADAIDDVAATERYDAKTRLQERAQALLKVTPTYQVVAESGPDHAKVFEVAAYLGEEEWGRARGSSKKEAEQGAAAAALGTLLETVLESP